MFNKKNKKMQESQTPVEQPKVEQPAPQPEEKAASEHTWRNYNIDLTIHTLPAIAEFMNVLNQRLANIEDRLAIPDPENPENEITLTEIYNRGMERDYQNFLAQQQQQATQKNK